MQYVSGQITAVIVSFAEKSPGWLLDITSYLNELDYQVYEAASPDDAWRLLESQKIDTLITASHAKASAFLKAVRKKIIPDQLPVIALLYEKPPDEIKDTEADVVALSASPQLFEHQLRTFITLHQEQIDLRQKNLQLQAELLSEKQSNDGLEVLKNAIVWTVAHELRTPLLQVKTAIALLAEDAKDFNTLIGLAQIATSRLEIQVQSITLLNEIINESPERRNFEAVPVTEMVDSAIRNLRRTWEHRENIERVEVRMGKKLPPVLADKQRIVYAVQLLIDNALRFSRDEVIVPLTRLDAMICIAVADLGIGIPKQHQAKIFDLFFQGDHSSTRRVGGMGIGLAIARFILEQHGVQIQIDSEVGKGSTFSFLLPIARLDEGEKRARK